MISSRETRLMFFCFAAIYLIWGSTYLAIKIAIDAFPPFFLSGCRFLFAAAILLSFGLVCREPALTSVERRLAFRSGPMLVLANALVCVAEMSVSSGFAAVIAGTLPLWILMLNWSFFSGPRPSLRQLSGVAVAVTGIALLMRSAANESFTGTWYGVTALFVASFVWAIGTLIQRKAGHLRSLFRFTGEQLALGGGLALVFSLIFERGSYSKLAAIGAPAIAAFLYLALFGSVVAFSCYLWLSSRVEPSKMSTYALVNPLVAVWLGWALAGESVNPTMAGGTAAILLGLYLVIIPKRKKLPAP